MVSQFAKSSDIEEKEYALNYLNDIIIHVIVHFEYEENVLFEVGYEDHIKHKNIHDKLLDRAKEIRNAVEMENIDYMKAFAFIFDEIIIGHLLCGDIRFYSYFQNEET